MTVIAKQPPEATLFLDTTYRSIDSLRELPPEQDLTAEIERTRTGDLIRLGGVTRLVRTRPI